MGNRAMQPDTYEINDDQWHVVNSALLAAIAICSVHVPEMRDTMLKASYVMDDIIDASDADKDEAVS